MSLPTDNKSRGSRGLQLLGVILVVTLSIFGYKYYSKYSSDQKDRKVLAELQQQYALVQNLLTKWEDAIRLAGMTPRVAIAPQVAQLQSIHREMERLQTNPCFDKSTTSISKAMNNGIFAFEMFINYSNNSTASEATDSYLKKSQDGIAAGVDQIRGCVAEATNIAAPK